MDVGVDAAAGGGGTVRVAVGLDRQAVRRLPDLADQLEVDDLRRAGWEITGPAREADGRTWVRASKPFGSPEEAARVVAEVAGPQGPFRDFRLVRRTSFLKTTTEFSGVVDLGPGLESFGDDELRARLGGTSLGADVAELERQLGAALDRVFRIRVSARLPGSIESNAPAEADNGAVWAPRLGERVVLDATGESWNLRPLVLGGVALISGGACVALVVARRRRR